MLFCWTRCDDLGKLADGTIELASTAKREAEARAYLLVELRHVVLGTLLNRHCDGWDG